MQNVSSYSGLNAYYEHSLDISMRTSSGDTIDLNFLNQKSLEAQQSTQPGASSQSLTFSSLEQFSFDISTNGLTQQDKQEIKAFIEIATPYINNFLSELSQGSERSPINSIVEQLGKKADEILQPSPVATSASQVTNIGVPATSTTPATNESIKDIATIYQEKENERKSQQLEQAIATVPVQSAINPEKVNQSKHDIVQTFDHAVQKFDNLEKFFDRATTFLEKLLDRLEKASDKSYA